MRLSNVLVASLFVSTSVVGCEDEALPPPTLAASADVATIMSGDTVILTFEIDNFTLSGEEGHAHLERAFDPGLAAQPDPMDAEDVAAYDGPREGHVHVYLDDYMTNPIAMATTHEVEVVIEAEPGAHLLMCRLHGLDHKIIEPQITDTIELTVQ